MKRIMMLLAVATLFTMCKNEVKPTRTTLIQEIRDKEAELVSSDYDLVVEKSQKLIDTYQAFVAGYPDDSLAPEMLMRCATVASNNNQDTYAITLYKRIYDTYPQSPLRSEALFRQAFTYDNMGNPEHAKPLYEQFLVEFPEDPLVNDVKILLLNVGKSSEELIQYLLENNTEEENGLPL